MTTASCPIAVAYGDGIGPEIMEAALRILEAAGARLDVTPIEVGEKVYQRGISSGIEPAAWDTLRQTKVLLKGPITTPQGGGVKSLNVTIRKTLGLFANVRPCRSYAPFIHTNHAEMDLVIIRENEEDLYAGIEHRQTDEVVQCLKLITRPGTEKIIRYAFEYTRRRERRKLTCMSKDNIMKLTDGLFHRVFDEVAAEYPDIETEHLIVDIGMARLADAPELFDVVVTPNLYGDIVSDIAAEISGSVGLAGSANIGQHGALFEAIHGSAPTIAGKNIANPSGLILAGCKMLAHIAQGEIAERVHNALLCAIEDGIHTIDIYDQARSRALANTTDFADAVIQRLGNQPQRLHAAHYSATPPPIHDYARRTLSNKELVGVDVFVDRAGISPDDLAAGLRSAAANTALDLVMITNRGVKVWPEGFPETFCTDHWRCRFQPPAGGAATHRQIVDLLRALAEAEIDFIKTEHLCTFDGEPGFSLGQGQ